MNNEDKILQMLTVMQERLDTMQAQLNENTEIIKAVLHNQEYANAKLEGLELTTAKADALHEIAEDTQDTKAAISALNDRLFVQETALNRLKLAK